MHLNMDWILRHPHKTTQILLILFAAASFGCSSEPSESSTSQEQHNQLPQDTLQDIALKLCQYSRGPFPNWMQYQEIIPYLRYSEAQAIKYMASRLLAEVPVASRPRYLAISRFIAQNTLCTLQQTNPLRDQTGAIGFALVQKYPTVPNVPDIPCHTADESCISQWVAHLTNHWNGDYREQPISIILNRDDNHHYTLRSEIDRSYALPLKIQTFWQTLDKYDFELAAQHLYQICDSDPKACQQFYNILTADIRFARYTAAVFENQVAIENIRYQAVSLTGNSGYTAAELTLNHHGQYTFSHIVFQTDEFPPQICELQATRSVRENDPLVITPGSQTKAWCILRQNTSPQVKLDAVIASYRE